MEAGGSGLMAYKPEELNQDLLVTVDPKETPD